MWPSIAGVLREPCFAGSQNPKALSHGDSAALSAKTLSTGESHELLSFRRGEGEHPRREGLNNLYRQKAHPYRIGPLRGDWIR